MLRGDGIRGIVDNISVAGVLLDPAGTIVEMSQDWKAQSKKWTTQPNVAVGKNYFEYCIRPDQHSIEILRGFKDLLAKRVDFFSTIYWLDKTDGKEWFLIAASPQSPVLPNTVVVHIDITAILRGNSQLSALMLGLGAAASGQVEATITSTIRSAIAETLSRPRPKPSTLADEPSIADQKQLAKLTKSQIEILSYLADGMSNIEIAKARGISINTVKDQVATVIEKLDVSNRTQAALFAARNNIRFSN
jgi:DNA-binding CsgD family transcriptional regulator